MKNTQAVPIPFAILIVAGVVSLFSLVADRRSRAGIVTDNSLQMQTVEQERVAAFYFRVLSWVSDLTSRSAAPAKPIVRRTQPPQSTKTPLRHNGQCRVELCALRSGKNPSAAKQRMQNIN
jgi:hypothetical protein